MKLLIKLILIVSVAIFSVMRTVAIRADDWPVVRGDILGTGVAKSAVPENVELIWKYPAGKDAAFDATAVVAGGIVYIGDSAGAFHAIRLADGQSVWKKEFADSGFSAGAAIENGSIYIGDVNGIARCLDSADGKERWTKKLDGEVYAGPTPIGDDVLFTCEAGTLSALTKNKGDIHWTFHIEAPLRCTPTVAAGRVLLAGCDSRLHIINVADGKQVSTVEIDGPTGATPAMRGERAYFGTESGTFFAIATPANADDKPKIEWQFHDKQRNQPIRSAAAVTDQLVVFGSQSKAIYALDPAKGGEKWKLPTRSRVDSSPVIAANRVVAATSTGKIYLLDIGTGQIKWEYDAGGGFTASPAIVDGRIIIGNTDGTLYCFGTKGGRSSRN
jgi:outer membrane protein assembly factor BamB